MFNFFHHKKKENPVATGTSTTSPPEWTPAPERSHTLGLYNEAPETEYRDAQAFCDTYPPNPARLVPSYALDRINAVGCKAWGLELPPLDGRFQGTISNLDDSKGRAAVVHVVTGPACKDVCVLSDLPIVAGLYEVQGKAGVYYEVMIQRMEGIIAVGSAVRPYPSWRLPGWNRLSAGLHLDDLRKFFEDADGGRDYNELARLTQNRGVQPGDTIGLGYEFSLASVFFTWNGLRLPDAFSGVYVPRHTHDVFAAIGVEGANELQVNFGGELFRWKEGNEWAWRVEGHVGRLSGTSGAYDEDLPAYG